MRLLFGRRTLNIIYEFRNVVSHPPTESIDALIKPELIDKLNSETQDRLILCGHFRHLESEKAWRWEECSRDPHLPGGNNESMAAAVPARL